MRTVEAVIQPNGEVLLVEPVHLASPRRALVTIMEEAPHPHDAALLSEAALGEDWNRPEEDVAWAHLQPGKSSKFTSCSKLFTVHSSLVAGQVGELQTARFTGNVGIL
jgi:hypothetical protein